MCLGPFLNTQFSTSEQEPSTSSYPGDPVKSDLIFAPLPLVIDTLILEISLRYPGQLFFRNLLPIFTGLDSFQCV